MRSALSSVMLAAAFCSCIGISQAVVYTTLRVSEVEVCWQSSSNTSYQVQFSTDPTSHDWNNLGPPVLAAGPTTCLRDAVSGSCRFYRVDGVDAIWIRASERGICWDSTSNIIYQVQYRLESDPNVWIDLGPAVTATGPVTCVAGPMGEPSRSYRVLGPDVVWVPAGTFVMGSPESDPDRDSDEVPQTTVTLTRGFYMGKYEVTQGEYLAVMGNNPSFFNGVQNFYPPQGDYGTVPTRPVEQVTWFEATNYCGKLTEQERAAGRLPEGYIYRLPTEAEWEYACRAGTTTRFGYGDDPGYTNLTDYAWSGKTWYGTTHPVGQKLPNPWGLYDMHGNVGEWSGNWWSWWLPGGSVTDPPGPAEGRDRTLRGGDFFYNDFYCRSASRVYLGPGARVITVGFRVVLAPGVVSHK